MKQKIFIVIAAYNEESSIVGVIKGLKKEGYNNIMVVDDGSKDNTYDLAREQKVNVLRHIINRGQGAALKTGIDYALSQEADVIVTFDADGQHNPKEIKDLINPVIKGKVDVALGSRFLKKDSNTPVIRKLFLKFGVLVIYLMSGIKLTDSHNGFRVLSRKAAQTIQISSDKMEHASEILDEIHKKSISYKEVPVTITYTDYSKAKGQSTLNSFQIGFRMIFRKLMK